MVVAQSHVYIWLSPPEPKNRLGSLTEGQRRKQQMKRLVYYLPRIAPLPRPQEGCEDWRDNKDLNDPEFPQKPNGFL